MNIKKAIVRQKLKVIAVGCAALIRVALAIVCGAGAVGLFWLTHSADGYLAVLYFAAAMMATVKTTDLLYKCGAWVTGQKGVKH